MIRMALNWRHALARLAPIEWKPWALLAAVYVAVYVLALIFGGPTASNWVAGSRALLVPPGLLAAAAALGVWQQRRPLALGSGARGRLRQVWALLGLALLFWTLSHAFALVLLVSRPEPLPLPSFADLARLAGYVLAGAALLNFPLAPRELVGRLRLVLDGVVMSGALAGLGWLIFLRPVMAGVSEGVPGFWAAFYPVADLLLLLILTNVFLAAPHISLPPGLGLIALALLCFLLADLAQTYHLLQGGSVAMGFVGLGWLLGLAILGLAAVRQRAHGLVPASQADGQRLIRLRAGLKAMLPIAATFVLTWYVLLDIQARGQPDLLALGLTVVLAVVLVARQGALASEVELRQYAQLVSSLADPAFVCDADGRLRLVNPALLAATGYEADELLRRPAARLFADGRLPLAVGERPSALFDTGWSGDVAWRRRDGTVFLAYLALRPVPSDPLARPGLVGTAHDLAEHKRHEARLLAAYAEVATARRALEELNAQLEAKVAEKTASLSDAYARLAAQHEALQTLDQLKSEFVSLVSHELRAPLTNISGGIELVLSAPGAVGPKTRRSLTLVQSEIQRLTHFVETILDLSALEAGRLPLYPAPMEIRPALEAVLLQFGARPGAERLYLSLPSERLVALADERAFASVLFQLLDNALKYAPAGRITVGAAALNGRVEVTVSDEGPGIPPARLDKVFDRFERLDAADNRDDYGHGLGLYMARRLTEAQAGGIRAENAPAGGACFTFWIPAIEADDAEQNPVG
jgi:PAS domain S-box-containing protein